MSEIKRGMIEQSNAENELAQAEEIGYQKAVRAQAKLFEKLTKENKELKEVYVSKKQDH